MQAIASPVPSEFVAALTAQPDCPVLKCAIGDWWEERGRGDWASGWRWLGENGKWPDAFRISLIHLWFWDVTSPGYEHLPSVLPTALLDRLRKSPRTADLDHKSCNVGCTSLIQAFEVAVECVGEWLTDVNDVESLAGLRG